MRYCPYFCEENVWHLCRDDVVGVPIADRRAVFVSNAARNVRMARQRAGGGAVVQWDYHVVLWAQGALWDLDCTLGAPVPMATWLDETFVDDDVQFRVVNAAVFVEVFASDRSHMDPRGHAFPPWRPIGRGMNLPRFVDMTDAFVGDIVDLPGMRRLK